MHPAEGEMIYRATNEKVPYFNAPVFLESKTPVGKVDEIFGPTTEMVRMSASVICSAAKRGVQHRDISSCYFYS